MCVGSTGVIDHRFGAVDAAQHGLDGVPLVDGERAAGVEGGHQLAVGVLNVGLVALFVLVAEDVCGR